MNMWVMAEGGKRVQRVGNVVMRDDDMCSHLLMCWECRAVNIARGDLPN